MQSRSCGQDNEIHDEVREEHARNHILGAFAELLIRGAFSLGECASHGALLFNLLSRLPKEEVWRYGCAKNSNQHGKVRRSEEHTSELQSLRHLVCRLLLEKKKTQQK